ncbi:hypothetical protein ABZT00_41560, partial [Streptomyces sp. NPDC005486]
SARSRRGRPPPFVTVSGTTCACRTRRRRRLAPGPLPRALLLAAEHPTRPGDRLDLGLDRLQHADLPTAPTAPAVAPPVDEAPLHLLSRRVHQAVSGGRRVLGFPDSGTGDGGRLRRVGLATAGDLLDEVRSAAADRSRDAFGRLLPADPGRFARAWLAAAVYTGEVERALCAAAWGASAQVAGPAEVAGRRGQARDAQAAGHAKEAGPAEVAGRRGQAGDAQAAGHAKEAGHSRKARPEDEAKQAEMVPALP